MRLLEISEGISMWIKGTIFHKELAKDAHCMTVRFKCGMCSSVNKVYLKGFYPAYFTSRDKHDASTSQSCNECGDLTCNFIRLRYENRAFSIGIETVDLEVGMQHYVDVNSIYFSFSDEDTRDADVTPFGFDVLESVIGNNSYANYVTAIAELKDLLDVEEVRIKPTVLKFIFANVISIYETYLFDLVINAVNSDEKTLRRVVQDYKIFGKEKIEKHDIFTIFETVKDAVIEALKKLTYHNLGVTIPLYRSVLEIDFSDEITGLPEAILIRHDIVHRNGRRFNGQQHDVTLEKVDEIMRITNRIVDYIHEEFVKKEIAILGDKASINYDGHTHDLSF